jgi:stearoyl-CoA desaturase (delta-9 desaturase)
MEKPEAPGVNGKSRSRRWLEAAPFILAHLAVFGAFWSGVTWQSVVLCFVLLFVRVWGVTAGYHRYFAHRAYKTSRAFQLLLAVLAQSSSQKGVLWWAAHHRVHHKHSDEPGDVHSPVQKGFLYAHLGWLFDDTTETRWDKIRDFAKYPELRWLNRYWVVPPAVLAVSCFLIAGWPGLFIGFFASTVLLWHNTFLINSLTHVWGRKRFDTADQSRNNMLTALLTLGEGWHNNHHHYPSACRNGFYWWEIDATYYVLKMLSWIGVVWDIRGVPEHVLREGRGREPSRPAPTRAPQGSRSSTLLREGSL